jgi:hypothetical protein
VVGGSNPLAPTNKLAASSGGRFFLWSDCGEKRRIQLGFFARFVCLVDPF